MRRSRVLLWGLLLLAFASCAGSGAPDPERLAALPPLPYRIAVVGGAVLPIEQRDPAGAATSTETEALRTYDGRDAEPVPFDLIAALLERGRLANSLVFPHLDDPEARERVAFAARTGDAFEEARLAAERAGADLLLVLEGLRDAPVIELGVNARWPVATVAWLLVGLGMFIPDHTFESQVSLRASLRDVHSGAVLVDDLVIAPGAIDLSLVERTTWVGIVTSILIPPPLVSSNPEDYAGSVRSSNGDRIALRLLATLKTPETLERLRRALRVGVEIRGTRGGGLELVVRSRQDLLSVAVEIGEKRVPMDELRANGLLEALRRSRAPDPAGEGLVHRAALEVSRDVKLVRVLVSTVDGLRASSTWRARE